MDKKYTDDEIRRMAAVVLASLDKGESRAKLLITTMSALFEITEKEVVEKITKYSLLR